MPRPQKPPDTKNTPQNRPNAPKLPEIPMKTTAETLYTDLYLIFGQTLVIAPDCRKWVRLSVRGRR